MDKLLHNEMKNFVDRIEDMLNEYKVDLDEFGLIKFYFHHKLKPETAMNHIVEKVLPWKKYIETRDDNFFYKNKKIFGDLPNEHVDYFSDLWVSKKLSIEDKDEIWDFFETFIAFAEEYKKKV